MFENAESYNQGTGRVSRQMAALFVQFVGIERGDRVLDIGCGTGALTFAIAKDGRPSKIAGIDPSAGFIDYARSQSADARLELAVGDAQSLRFTDGAFDKTMSLLVIGFLPDAAVAAKEMRRVTKPGGVVATCWWDAGRENEFHQRIWDAIAALDPTRKRPTGGPMAFGSPNALLSLWNATGLIDVKVVPLAFFYESESVEHFWRYQYVEGQGGAAAYVFAMSEDRREVLKQRFQETLLGSRSDRPFAIQAKAWAIKGVVPPG
jgi:ubiquinone/menaquinone biosynthesis C-methylase UbiE